MLVIGNIESQGFNGTQVRLCGSFSNTNHFILKCSLSKEEIQTWQQERLIWLENRHSLVQQAVFFRDDSNTTDISGKREDNITKLKLAKVLHFLRKYVDSVRVRTVNVSILDVLDCQNFVSSIVSVGVTFKSEAISKVHNRTQRTNVIATT